MIIFKRCKYRNFLSTGDTFTVIELNSSSSTLVVGQNGSGKSTLLDALSFALFGKPHRDIKKPQLVNSINDRNCEVEVEFSIGNTNYVVSRGIKPNKFEILQNGVLLNQESHSRDYQKVLEQNILKLNHKSFHQIVVLGSSSFVPFMQLPSQHRREVIEDLLDINIFTKMNVLLKEKSAKLREQLTHVTYEADVIREKIAIQQKYIFDLKKRDAADREKDLGKIAEITQEINELFAQNKTAQEELDSKQNYVTSRLNTATKKKQTLLTFETQISGNIRGAVKELKFYEENDNCPTCSQILESEFKAHRIHTCNSRAKELLDGKSKLEAELSVVEESLVKIQLQLKECNQLSNTIQSNSNSVQLLQRQIHDLQREGNSISKADITEAERSLAELLEGDNKAAKLKHEYYEEGTYNQAMAEMLKDTGIKTKIIRQYLPVMNKLINGYLQILDFFVSFNLNESFEEVIRSRHRDDFTYPSFSEGEKSRIDLALLFTWRQIARMKNSTSTNLLVLDETFDSSLDAEGVDNLIKILGTLEDNTNVFIISHKADVLDGKFKSKLEFYKEKNFSYCK
jgi:DNA repair exonuclease SbcCD ATPase subunit